MRYQSPVPFHAVRTRFLGNIASPIMSASPLDAVKALWGGDLPEFNSLDTLNELSRIHHGAVEPTCPARGEKYPVSARGCTALAGLRLLGALGSQPPWRLGADQQALPYASLTVDRCYG
jgi:hypothetical protein